MKEEEVEVEVVDAKVEVDVEVDVEVEDVEVEESWVRCRLVDVSSSSAPPFMMIVFSRWRMRIEEKVFFLLSPFQVINKFIYFDFFTQNASYTKHV